MSRASTRVLFGLASSLMLSAAIWAPPTSALAVDATGVFSLSEPLFGSALSFRQTGSSLSLCVSGGGIFVPAMEGTIDPVSGAFGLALPHPIFNGSVAVCALTLIGTFAADGSSFSASFDEGTTCVPPPFTCQPQCLPAASGPVTGTRTSTTAAACCGDGRLDAGEPCDYSVAGGNGCCSQQCAFATGSFCPGADVCMVGVCDGAGTCTYQPAPAGSFCTDGDPCTMDSCDGAGSCTHQPSNDPVCTGIECPTCARFDPGQNACVVTPQVVCQYASEPAVDSLVVKRAGSPSGNRLTWKFPRGQATTAAQFGSPATTDDYDLCLFDFSGSTPNLLFGARVRAASLCNGKPCWKELGNPPGSTGAKYRDPAAAVAGVRDISLKPGSEGRARISLKAKGPEVPALPGGPLPLPLHLQLRTETGGCWESPFSTARVNDGKTFKAQGP